MRTTRHAFTLLAFAASPGAYAQVVFPVSFAPSAAPLTVAERAAVTSHVQAAGQAWMDVLLLAGPRSIEVEIALDALPTGNGSSVTSVFVGTFGGRDLFEQSATAELRTGIDPNGATPDIRITFGIDYLRNELWFDPDPIARTAAVPIAKTDAMSVALHELGHAFAYNGWANGQGVPPATYWSTFDRWMMPGTPSLFGGTSAILQFGTAPELTTDNIHHWANGPIPRSKRVHETHDAPWDDGAPRPLPGCDGVPSADAPPSADAIGAKGALPAGLLYELMNGVVFYRGSRYDISPLDVATLKDVGLAVRELPFFRDGFEGG